MELVFANPYGFLSLLGIPLVIVIHCLQRPTQPKVISTLFLLQKLPSSSDDGNRFIRLTQSLAFWMQLLAILLISWLIAEPRWLSPSSRQNIVFILDSTQSMNAFRQELHQAINSKIDEISRTASHTVWYVMETESEAPMIYNGMDKSDLLLKVSGWNPEAMGHSIAPAFLLAEQLARNTGRVIYFTDHPINQNSGVEVVSVGKPIDNVGWTGHVIEQVGEIAKWKATAKNYSQHIQERTLTVEGDPQISVKFLPGQIKTCTGAFPLKDKKRELVLSEDRFSLDDRLPLIVPKSKIIVVDFDPKMSGVDEIRHCFESIEDISFQSIGTDLIIKEVVANPSQSLKIHEIQVPREDRTTVIKAGPWGVEQDRLMKDLGWDGFYAKVCPDWKPSDNARVLLWCGDFPVIWIEHNNNKQSLCLNFSWKSSNAVRYPAIPLLLHRYVEELRNTKLAYHARACDFHELIHINSDSMTSPLILCVESISSIGKNKTSEFFNQFRAPGFPSFFQIKSNQTVLFDGASCFADVREADFSQAATSALGEDKSKSMLIRNSTASSWDLILVLGILVCLLIAWWAQRREQK